MLNLDGLRRTAAAGAVLVFGSSVALAQGVIPPPAEGQPIAPQAPVATTINPGATGIPTEQPRMQGPASVADLAEGLLDAVVNISTAQSVEATGRGLPRLDAPDGSPLREFFDDLLKNGEGGGSRNVEALGSGFVIDPSGIVVTNNHVIADADEITVNFADGSQLEATIVGVDPKTDIAVLKVEPEAPLAAVPFGDSEAVRIGDWVMAIGNPFGLGGSVSVGIVSARGRNINAGPYDNFIQTDAAINRGNSGGPLFDMYGRVIGINTAIISPTGGSIGIGFSIPALLAENVVGQLREFGETRRGWLGVRLQEVTDEIADGLGLPNTAGALIMGITESGPAAGSLEIGDVVTRFDGRAIATWRDLPRIVAESPVGEEIELEVLRRTSVEAPVETRQVRITLGRLEDSEAAEVAAATAEEAGEAGAAEQAAAVSGLTLGMRFADLSDDLRSRYELADGLEGAVVTEVDAQSNAAEKGIEEGVVVTEIAQEPVADAAAARSAIDRLRTEGRRNALMLVAAANGDLRFVVVPID